MVLAEKLGLGRIKGALTGAGETYEAFVNSRTQLRWANKLNLDGSGPSWLDQGNLGDANQPEFEIAPTGSSLTPPITPTSPNGHETTAEIADLETRDLVSDHLPGDAGMRALRNFGTATLGLARTTINRARNFQMPQVRVQFDRPHIPRSDVTLPTRADVTAAFHQALPNRATVKDALLSVSLDSVLNQIPPLPKIPNLPRIPEITIEDIQLAGIIGVAIATGAVMDGFNSVKNRLNCEWNGETGRHYRAVVKRGINNNKNYLAGAAGFATRAGVHLAADRLHVDPVLLDQSIRAVGTAAIVTSLLANDPSVDCLISGESEAARTARTIRSAVKYVAIACLGYETQNAVAHLINPSTYFQPIPDAQPAPRLVQVTPHQVPDAGVVSPKTPMSPTFATPQQIPDAGVTRAINLPKLPDGWHQPANGLKNLARLLSDNGQEGHVNAQVFSDKFRKAYGLWKDGRLGLPENSALAKVFYLGDGTGGVNGVFGKLMLHGKDTLQTMKDFGIITP